MAISHNDQLSQIETTCGSLLYELQMIWDEVGESNDERDKMILEIEQECLEVYRRKVDQANHSRAYLRQAIADAEAELAAICSALGERPVHLGKSNQNALSLKEELKATTPQLEEMRKRKNDRLSQFLQVLEQIRKISSEVLPDVQTKYKMNVDESDLSTRKLEELQRELEALQKEKTDRLKQVLEHLRTLNTLCLVLGIDFKQTVMEVHPSLEDTEGSKIVSNEVIDRLASVIQSLREVKLQRMQKLQDLATAMLELWNLMDTPMEEQQLFQNVTCNVAASEHEITEPNTLSVDFLNYVEAEVVRLEELKASKMKELVLRKKAELEELRRRTHLVESGGDNEVEISIEVIESGAIDPSLIMERIEAQISCVKEEAFSRKEILERVEKWMAACEEEAWLEEYNRDENRYSAGRGAHLALKHAEKARATTQRIPGIVEALCNKVIAWEEERGIEFTYDGVRLLSMLEEYSFVRQEKEQERKRQRDQKKLQSQFQAEQEALFGSKPSPSKPQCLKKVSRTSSGFANRRLSLGAAALQPMKPDFPCVKTTSSTKRGNEFTFASPAKKGVMEARNPVKLPSFNADNMNSLQSEPPRKSFGATNTINQQSETPRKPFSLLDPANILPLTPSLSIHSMVREEENQLMPISTPRTPGTVMKPMQMAITPATIRRVPDEKEYSFEERRLAVYYRR
ncbi:65-kDa microtubule-associated protein 3-like [Dendrobium catenatum]|uniref:65-kDa microtubule-associated protein 3 n=1 Tax=Dendrobium catenatum TaxID=906689 RepID=A0A2I0WWH1_9ASPA|nr:65-kDa microtubule-associated protein 3-like [Dendrobium catenatum]PKU79993.1 65-kDa microtubule-associated protein 3 [Dendrobium catenatum]